MNSYQEAKWIVIIYLIIVILTTAVTLYEFPKTQYFWTLMLASIIWIITGALSVWYAWINGRPDFSIFFFVMFIGLYWTAIYYTLKDKPINIPNLQIINLQGYN